MKSFLLACLIFAFVGFSHGLECYECTSGDSCEDEYAMPASHLSTCSGGEDTCMKLKIETAGVEATTRSCVAASSCSEGHTDVDVFFVSVETWTTCCTTDGCNGAASVVLSLTLLSLSALISIII